MALPKDRIWGGGGPGEPVAGSNDVLRVFGGCPVLPWCAAGGGL